MLLRTPAAPHLTGRRHALRLLALPIAVVMATGVVAASAISLRNGSPGRVATGPVATLGSSPTPGDDAVSSLAPDPTPASTPANAGPLFGRDTRLIHRGSASKKVIALTFDDGWSAKNGRTIISILLHQHVKATFFVNSVWLAEDPELWRSIANAGFVVGNHTYLHGDVTKMGWAEMQADLKRNARVWEAVTGTKMAPLFRPPYGYRSATTDLAAARAGYPDVILWDVDPKDTVRHLTDGQIIHNAELGRNGSIVILHIGPDATPRILERIIWNYRSRGFTFVTVPELLAPATPAPAPNPSAPVPSTVPTPVVFSTGPRLPGFPS